MKLRKLFLCIVSSICLFLFLIFYITHVKEVARSEKLQKLSSISEKTLNFKFAVISDPHISVFESSKSLPNEVKMFKDSVSLLENTVKEINDIPNIKFVCVLGDLTKDAEPWNVDKVKEILDRLQAPYYVVLGNHDVSIVDSHIKNMGPSVTRSTMIWTFQGHGFSGPNRYWSLNPLPGVHLIGLDSTMIGD
ncbi:metallophosphoesterase family protein [Caldicellulosiruptor sp. F32]|uniref:metallophosphoesterase family protein n=1 Tax=Caldicellulosiruptor sp. F32 TaxID=1214564 RepID=UPI00039D008F|nr:metallophosphoesterase [Caldicellulosiruptor sp. F32]